MRLGRLSGLEQEKINDEYKDLEGRIAGFEEILSCDANILAVVKQELQEIKQKYGDERHTRIENVADEIDIEDLIEQQDCAYTLTHFGYIKRQPTSVYRAQRRGGRGVSAMSTREEDFAKDIFTASTHDTILFFSDRGKVYKLKGYQIPETGRSAKGMNIVNLLELENGEKITAQSIRETTEATAGCDPDVRAKPIVAEAVSVFGKVVLILLKLFAGLLVFGLIMGACALIIGLFALVVGGGGILSPFFPLGMTLWVPILGIFIVLIPVILLIYVLMCLIASRKPGGTTVLVIFLLWLASFIACACIAIREDVGDRFRAKRNVIEQVLNTEVVIDNDTTTVQKLLKEADGKRVKVGKSRKASAEEAGQSTQAAAEADADTAAQEQQTE